MQSHKEEAKALAKNIVGAAIEVHRTLGPGLLHNAYLACLCRELMLRGIPFERDVSLATEYKGMPLECGCRGDLVVDELVLVQVVADPTSREVAESGMRTSLCLSELWLGLVIDFSVDVLDHGVRLIANEWPIREEAVTCCCLSSDAGLMG